MRYANRKLDDPEMDDVDHALGRPVDPIGYSYRNRYVLMDRPSVDKKLSSPHWRVAVDRSTEDETWVCLEVTDEGRRALAIYLAEIRDRWRLFVVRWGVEAATIAAESHYAAKRRYWLDLPWPSGTFAEFHRTSRASVVESRRGRR